MNEMPSPISPNTRAILLLTAPLIAGRRQKNSGLLTPDEYRKLAFRLREAGGQPADLLSGNESRLLRDCHDVIDQDRLKRLLGRGFLLSQAVERWQSRALWVISRADAEYPRILKARLGVNAPALLYGCGDRAILNRGGLAVVGSRHVDDALLEYACAIGELAAKAGRMLVSGGARGIDQAAMRGALEAGGQVLGVLAHSLQGAAMNRAHRLPLMEGRLALISPYDPSAGFNVGHAMQRNKLIYALADAALVVNAVVNNGGTWAGTVEQLEKMRSIPVYVRSTGTKSEGLDALIGKGAVPWPNPQGADDLDACLCTTAATAFPSQSALWPEAQGPTAQPQQKEEIAQRDAAGQSNENDPATDPAEALYQTAQELIILLCANPTKPVSLTEKLNITKSQTDIWLKRLVAEGRVEKIPSPVRYVARQADLLANQPHGGFPNVKQAKSGE